MLGVYETALKENPCLFLLDVQMQISFFLQETHSCDTDVKWWRSQWGDQIFCCHASPHSAGFAILFNKFKGDVLESVSSTEGRWLLIAVKFVNSLFILGNVYGYNYSVQAKNMSTEVTHSISVLMKKYQGALLIMGGDFNDAPDDFLDRFPPHMSTYFVFPIVYCGYLQILKFL